MASTQTHLDALWHALPSVNRYTDEHRPDAPALVKDIDAFVKNTYRACFSNADHVDADAFAADFMAALPKPPVLTNIPPLPAPPAEPASPVAPAPPEAARPGSSGESARPPSAPAAPQPAAPPPAHPPAGHSTAAGHPGPIPTEHAAHSDVEIGTIPKAFFVDHVLKALVAQIVPTGKALLALRPPPPPPAPEAPAAPAAPAKKGGEKVPVVVAPVVPVRVYTPDELEFEAQLTALVEALVDDRAPLHLLPFAEVLTVPCAKLVPVNLRNFSRSVRHPTHPACYDVMWKELEHEGVAVFDSFVAWFCQWSVRCFSNVTPKRAAIAAKKHWLDATAATGHMKLADFIHTARSLSKLYLHEDGDSFFAEHATAVTASLNELPAGSKATFLTVAPPVRETRGSLVDIEKLFVPDELDVRRHNDAYYNAPSQNRIVVVGKEGTGKTTFATKLADRLNAVDVNLFALALEALDAAPKGDELGVALHTAITEGHPINLDLQAKLVKRCLNRSATVHRGYVFGDIPAVTEANRFVIDKFIASCGFDQWPTAVVDVAMAPELYDDWRRKARDAITADYAHEVELRVQEAEAVAEKARKEEARAARKAERERRAERQAKIDAGEIEATEDDKAWAAQEQEPEEEPVPEVDEEGNPLEPEQIAAREAVKKAAVARRSLLAELRRQLHAGRQVPENEVQTDARKLPAWAPAVNQCIERHRSLTVTNTDNIVDRVEFVVDQLSLVASIVPQRPAVPPESLEGIEAGPDGDNTKADLYRNALQEAGMILSPFDNYCPVTKFEHGVLVAGSWAFSCHYRGNMYCFASESKLQRFIDFPSPYLTQRYDIDAPLLVLARARKVLTDAGLTATDLINQLAVAVNLTPSEIEGYTASWKGFEAEVARRAALVASRAAADVKALKAREERRKKAKEGDKKGKGKTAEKPGGKKKKEGEEVEDEKPVAEAVAVVEDAAPKVITTEERIQSEIDAASNRRLESTLPVLVSALTDVSKDNLLWLLERRVLPETVVILDWQAPRNEDEEAPAEEAEEEEEANPEPQVDDDGNPVPAKPKVEKPFDQNDEKMYRKFINKFLDELAIAPEEGDAAPAVDADGKEIPQPRRRQLFNLKNINLFGMSNNDAVNTIVRAVRLVQDKVLPPQDGEDLVVDPEEEEGEEVDDPIVAAKKKLAIPGKRAINQFGSALRYCPVTLKETGTLVTGDPANWVSYLSERYLFVTPEAMEKFKINPDRYLLSTPPTPPPPRIWVLGVPQSGHQALAESLGQRYGVPIFSLEYADLQAVLQAAVNPEGGVVNGVSIPFADVATSAALKTAQDISTQLRDFDANEAAKLKAKEDATARIAAREAVQADGGEVSELDEDEEADLQKATEFEPEEEEAKTERVSREMRRMAANLMRIEPFESKGYFLIGRPSTEVEVEQLLSFGAYPEVVVNVKLPSETYVNRRVDAEFAKRVAAYKVQVAQVKATRRRLLLKQRAVEIEKWRRRNIGGGDEDAEEEEMPEDPEEPTVDGARSDLETQYETETSAVAAVLAVLPDKRIPVVEVNGDLGPETVLATASAALSTNLAQRRSFFENPYAITYDQALDLIRTGRKFFSSFRFHDPVSLAAHRNGAPPTLKKKPDGRGIPIEPVIPEPEPLPPKPKRFKTVTRTNEETNEEEEVQVTDDEPEEEEPADAVEEEELEAEPELSPDELQEMQAELDAKRKAAADKLKNRACVLRNRVYFFKDEANLITFLTENPLGFWDQPPPLPAVPTIVAFMDEETPPVPTTGEKRPRTMAHHLAYNLRSTYLDSTKLLKWATTQLEGTKTAAAALATILSGEAISDQLLATILAARLLCSDVQSRGAVLLNLPRSSAQLRAMTTSGSTIHKVLAYGNYLASTVNEIDNIALVSTKLVEPRFSNAALIETWLAVDRNKTNRQLVRLSRPQGYPVRMHDTSTPQSYLMSTRSVYKTYCPYTWSREGKLIDSFGDTKFAAEYCGQQFLFSCDEYLQAFLENPQDFSGELTNLRELPTVLPRIIGAAEAKTIRADQLEHAACCPVTLYETREHKGLRGVTEPKAVPGNPDCMVEYNGLKYALVNKEAVNKFLRQPWVYVAGAVLPLATKLPFDKEEVRSQNTDVYVRRVLYENVARAMLAVAEVRPKFPGLDARDSALKFISLHLKAHNEANTEHRQRCYEESFTNYTERATLYKNIALDPPSDPAEEAEFRRRCALWDDLQDHPQCYVDYQHPVQKTKAPTS